MHVCMKVCMYVYKFNAAEDASRHCEDRQNKALMRSLKTPLFDVGASVLVRFRLNKHKSPRKTWALMGYVVDCRQHKQSNNVSFKPSNGNYRIEKWFQVSHLTSAQTNKTEHNKSLHL